MNITKGPVKTAIKMLVYGPEGVGKTTFAAKTPGCVFIDTEGSTRHMDVARFDPPADLNDVIRALDWVNDNPGEVGTVVIDTVDWLEKLLFNAVCTEKKIQNIEDIGYGKGYIYAKQKMQELLEKLDRIVEKGVNVCLVCHSMIRKFELPDEMGNYDRYMLKLNEKNIAPLVKEWVDLMLFANYQTNIVTDADGKTKKGRGGQKRVMYANHNACWDAKNRFGLPDEMPFDFDQIAGIFDRAPWPANAEPEKPAERVPAKAVVETVEKVPEPPKKSGKKKTEAPAERPESMKSDDPEKDALLEKLWGMMQASEVPDPLIVQGVVAEKEYYDIVVPIRDYEKDFISDVLIEAWAQVNDLCQTKIHDLPF